MNCKISLISWPIENQYPNNFYINLGEIYNKNIKNDINTLTQFKKDLTYLYPFRVSIINSPNGDVKITIYNIDDFIFFQKKYNLTVKIKIIGKPISGIIKFRTPILYDTTCIVPLFDQTSLPSCPEEKNIIHSSESLGKVCIVLPYHNPIERGILLDSIISHNTTFLLIGDKQGNNLDTTASLMSRYLLSKYISQDKIIKTKEDGKLFCILDAITLLEFMNLYKNNIIYIACLSREINEIKDIIRIWRYKGIIPNKKIYFYCPFY